MPALWQRTKADGVMTVDDIVRDCHKLVQKVMSDPSCYAVVAARTRDVERLDLRLPDLAGSLEPLVA